MCSSITLHSKSTKAAVSSSATATKRILHYDGKLIGDEHSTHDDNHRTMAATSAGSNNIKRSKGFVRVQSVLFTATASAVHFAAFEFARSGTISLFTSEKTGFSSPSASPISTICMTPFSIFVLWIYTKCLNWWGPRSCIILSTVLFALLLGSSALILSILESWIEMEEDACGDNDKVSGWRKTAQAFIFFLNVAQSSLVQLLYTQHWSFISSVTKDWEGASMWFAPIAGLGSIASTAAALGVQPVVDRFGLTGLLYAASILLLISCLSADLAYRIAQEHQFEPRDVDESCSRRRISRQPLDNHSESLVRKSLRLFSRVPILVTLCVEVMTCQGVSSIINFLYLMKLKECIHDDRQRASWTATWYARINFVSGLLQFCVLPLWMKYWKSRYQNSYEQRKIWLLMPLCMMASATLMSYQTENLSLSLVTFSFALYKILEYSVRGVAVEMVYQNLDYESRFLGKEVIELFVDRLGKSSAAVGLSLVSYIFGDTSSLDKFFVQVLSVASLVWFVASYPLANVTNKEKWQ